MRHLSLVESHDLPTHHSLADRRESDQPDQIDELCGRLAALGKDVSVEQVVEIGRCLVDEIYAGDLDAWRTRGPKPNSLRHLARNAALPVSSSTLYRAIAFYELSERTGGVASWTAAGLGVSHVRLVLGLALADQRRLLDLAVKGSWTAAELEREVVLVRGQRPKPVSRGGRPRMPRFVKTLHRLRKAAETREDMFGDLDAMAAMEPEQLVEIRGTLAAIRASCDELERHIEAASL